MVTGIITKQINQLLLPALKLKGKQKNVAVLYFLEGERHSQLLSNVNVKTCQLRIQMQQNAFAVGIWDFITLPRCPRERSTEKGRRARKGKRRRIQRERKTAGESKRERKRWKEGGMVNVCPGPAMEYICLPSCHFPCTDRLTDRHTDSHRRSWSANPRLSYMRRR